VVVSPEIITMLSMGLAILAATLGVAAWMHKQTREDIRRLEARMDRMDARMEAGFAEVREDLRALNTRVSGLESRVARLEGPIERLAVAAR
jgi:BMFP domain-containing protein YqiC